MRTLSQAHLPITHSSMSSEPIPIAHISEEIQIEKDPPSEEPEEIKDENESKVQAKSSVVPVDDLVSTLKSFRGSSSKAGNIGQIRDPEPFSGKDLTKLKAFLFNVIYISRACPISRMGPKESLLHCPISGMWLKSGLNPEFPVSLTTTQNGLITGIYLLTSYRIILVLSMSPPMSSTS